MPGWWGRRRSGVNVEDQAATSQPDHQRDHQRRIIERHRERRDDHRNPQTTMTGPAEYVGEMTPRARLCYSCTYGPSGVSVMRPSRAALSTSTSSALQSAGKSATSNVTFGITSVYRALRRSR
jgi:hypothetical protein